MISPVPRRVRGWLIAVVRVATGVALCLPAGAPASGVPTGSLQAASSCMQVPRDPLNCGPGCECVADVAVGETRYVVPWAVCIQADDSVWLSNYHAHSQAEGNATVRIYRTPTGFNLWPTREYYEKDSGAPHWNYSKDCKASFRDTASPAKFLPMRRPAKPPCDCPE